MNVFIPSAASPVAALVMDANSRRVRRRKTVGDAPSADLGIVVAGQDRVEPGLESDLYENVKIRVTCVGEDIRVEEEIAPFETVFVADPNLAIDTQEVLAPGAKRSPRTR